jgi:hypothetical protein
MSSFIIILWLRLAIFQRFLWMKPPRYWWRRGIFLVRPVGFIERKTSPLSACSFTFFVSRKISQQATTR